MLFASDKADKTTTKQSLKGLNWDHTQNSGISTEERMFLAVKPADSDPVTAEGQDNVLTFFFNTATNYN